MAENKRKANIISKRSIENNQWRSEAAMLKASSISQRNIS